MDFASAEFDLQTSAPWVSQELTKGRPIVISCPDDFPEEAEKERAIAERTAIMSIIWVPIVVSGSVAACIVLNMLR